MKLFQHDIGAEIISILTKGMYADPKDTIREYVQNGVDANAKKITIKIRQNNIVIQDTGDGMNKTIMRKAVRLGISDKNPKKSVGFMGIGLYSSFHLCDKLIIYSRVENEIPNKLELNFKEMRDLLEAQKENRIENDGEMKDQIALINLMQDHINLVEITAEDFPGKGTRVEMKGVENNFFESLSIFDEVAEYLASTIPLPFSPNFKHGKEIEEKIIETCREHNAEFKLVDLDLQINDEKKTLYRPYKDSDFISEPISPIYEYLDSNEGFLGIAWGCLNKANEIIKNEKVRGFLIKKHGFTIGNRNSLLPIFGAKFFNRYVGEFIIVHPKLLPNGARSDFEYSSLRTVLYTKIQNAAWGFNEYANKHQEMEKAEIELDKIINLYKDTKAEMGAISDSHEKLLTAWRILFKAYTDFSKRANSLWKIRDNRRGDADEILRLVKELIDDISAQIEVKARVKKGTQKKANKNTKAQTAEDIESAPASEEYVESDVKSLKNVVELIGITFEKEIGNIFDLLDEQFIKPTSKDDSSYKKILLKLKNDIEELFSESEE